MQEIETLIRKLETGATSNSEAMQTYSRMRGSILEHPKADLPRMMYENFIDSITDDLEVIKAKLNKENKYIPSASHADECLERCNDMKNKRNGL